MRNSHHHNWFFGRRHLTWFLGLAAILLVACISVPGSQNSLDEKQAPLSTTIADTSGPAITQIAASSKVFAKSDCTPTAITVTATISDPAGVAGVLLWYRIGPSQSFVSGEAASAGADHYTVTVKGTDVPGSEYGVWEFYLTADDTLGNQSRSATDTSVQLLPCVG